HADYFVRHLISTDQFTPEELEALNARFHKEAMQIVATKTARYLASHPKIALEQGRYFAKSVINDGGSMRDSVVKLFFCRLFYRNSLMRAEAEAAAHSPGGFASIFGARLEGTIMGSKLPVTSWLRPGRGVQRGRAQRLPRSPAAGARAQSPR